MKIKSGMVAVVAVLTATACGRSDAPPPDRFDDLSWMDTMSFEVKPVASPLETGLLEEEAAPAAVQAAAPRASAPRAATPVRRQTSTASRAPAQAPAPQGRVVVERNTARDAAIGAAGGAVIGAVAGGRNNRVKGAIIGGAAGAVIGGVIGHTVDKKERVVYDYAAARW
jgi:uncharacterized protein YcfJ